LGLSEKFDNDQGKNYYLTTNHQSVCPFAYQERDVLLAIHLKNTPSFFWHFKFL